MLVWQVSYKVTERGPWIDTGCHAPDAMSAWKLWTMWRTVHFVEEWHSAQVFEVSLAARMAALQAEHQGRKEQTR